MPVTIRSAEKRHVESLGRLGAMLMRTHYAFDPQRFLPPGESPESGYGWFLAKMMDEPDGHVFVAEEDGQDVDNIAGYIWVSLEPLSWKELRGPAGFIQDVAVRESSRRGGIAAQLMQAGIEWLREHGAPRVMLWTAAQNEAAQNLFRRLGFRDTMIEMTKELEQLPGKP